MCMWFVYYRDLLVANGINLVDTANIPYRMDSVSVYVEPSSLHVQVIINARRMRRRVTVVVLCVRLSVC